MRHGPFTVIAHCPLRSPLSLCSPTDLRGFKSASEVAALSAASSSIAATSSSPENLLLRSSTNRRVALFAHDLIIRNGYYASRRTSIVQTGRDVACAGPPTPSARPRRAGFAPPANRANGRRPIGLHPRGEARAPPRDNGRRRKGSAC